MLHEGSLVIHQVSDTFRFGDSYHETSSENLLADTSTPTQRLATLRAAKEAGLHIYVAVGPTYPECDRDDLYRTLQALADLAPVTIFHEPINLRADNAQKIAQAAASSTIRFKTEVFQSTQTRSAYAIESLQTVWGIRQELGITDTIHLWPDKTLGNRSIVPVSPRPRSLSRMAPGSLVQDQPMA